VQGKRVRVHLQNIEFFRATLHVWPEAKEIFADAQRQSGYLEFVRVLSGIHKEHQAQRREE